MTHAVCVFCGAAKFGCILSCKSCGEGPHDPLEFAYSFAFSSHYMDAAMLEQVKALFLEHGVAPRLSEGQEQMMLARHGNFGGAMPVGSG